MKISDLGTPRDPPEELEEMAGDVWASLLKLLPPRPDPQRSSRQWMDLWKLEEIYIVSSDVFLQQPKLTS